MCSQEDGKCWPVDDTCSLEDGMCSPEDGMCSLLDERWVDGIRVLLDGQWVLSEHGVGVWTSVRGAWSSQMQSVYDWT
jgi:hypothetical protein